MKTNINHLLYIKAVTIIVIQFSLISTSYAQVAGISASKVGTYCIDGVPAKDLEFEPSFTIAKSKQYWNSNNHLENSFSSSDSSMLSSQLAFRCTYGVTDKLEIGILTPADVSLFSIGAKYLLFKNNRNGIAVITGINMLIGNRIQSNLVEDPHDVGTFAAGLCFSHNINEKLFLDVDIQGQMLLRNANNYNHYDLFINSDIGYYIRKNTQLICGFSYYNNFFQDSKLDNRLLDIHPGLSYETGENFLIVISSPIGLLGKNEVQSYGVSIAFTMTIQ